MLTEAEYEDLAHEMLMQIEQAIEASGTEIEFESENEILTLEFPDGSRIIINKQRPLQQIWVAARSGGFHYRYDLPHKHWVRDGGQELIADLESFAGQQLKAAVRLR
ncbi:MAG TPA: iron donor protein CyaY [Acidiferrobacter sp.]|nr:iron donor protein CyaY [Acidiferrobacter sp.]